MISGVFGALGFGNMGGAIVRGLLAARTIEPGQVTVYDPDEERQRAARGLGCAVAKNEAELAGKADILLLAVKPQTMESTLAAISQSINENALIISVAAGISLDTLQNALPDRMKVVRVMPNTPALVGAGAAAFALGHSCSGKDGEAVREIFEAVGCAEQIDEKLMDAVTALSGSGPAYCFALLEAMVAAAKAQGLPAAAATRLAGQTLFGAGKLLRESGESPAALRKRVTSKGGTTEAGLNALANAGFADAVAKAINAAAARSRELGQ